MKEIKIQFANQDKTFTGFQNEDEELFVDDKTVKEFINSLNPDGKLNYMMETNDGLNSEMLFVMENTDNNKKNLIGVLEIFDDEDLWHNSADSYPTLIREAE